jgi:hypothetical protein
VDHTNHVNTKQLMRTMLLMTGVSISMHTSMMQAVQNGNESWQFAVAAQQSWT